MCGRYLGLQSGELLLSQIETSSAMIGYHGNQSRINGPGGWCALDGDTMPWIKVQYYRCILQIVKLSQPFGVKYN